MIAVHTITLNDDLQSLVADINQATWDDANDMAPYNVEALRAYLTAQDTIFVACYDLTDNNKTFLGMASARLQIKPYDASRWLYIDEVDVCADQRRKGAGKALMQTLLKIAQDTHCEEVWLGTEPDNHAANALYRSLDPDDIEQFIGYTYELVVRQD